MSYTIKKTTIFLTRGDTFKAQLSLTNEEGQPYEPQEGDVIRFACKKDYSDPDTEVLYDIQLTTAAGEVDTFITKGILTLTEEVY